MSKRKSRRLFDRIGIDTEPDDVAGWIAAGVMLLVVVGISVGYWGFGAVPSTKWVVTFQSDQPSCGQPPPTELGLDIQRQIPRYARNGRDGSITVDGDIRINGELQIALSFSKDGMVAVQGNLAAHYGHGVWQGADCKGTWTAVDALPVNKWWYLVSAA